MKTPINVYKKERIVKYAQNAKNILIFFVRYDMMNLS